MNEDTIVFLGLLAEDREVISYRKRLNDITGSVTATILLQQIIYWSRTKDWQPFFKFRTECKKHSSYRSGDSWTEELGFSGAEFDTAISKIGTKITKGTNKAEAYNKEDATGLVIYWTDANRVTWYHLNTKLLGNLIKSNYLVKEQSENTKKSDNPELSESENTTETITETTNKHIGNDRKKIEPLDHLQSYAEDEVTEDTAPYPQDQWITHRNEVLDSYTHQTGIKLNQGQKGELALLPDAPNFDISTYHKYLAEFAARGGYVYDVKAFCDGYTVYHKTGDIYEAMGRKRQGELDKPKERKHPKLCRQIMPDGTEVVW